MSSSVANLGTILPGFFGVTIAAFVLTYLLSTVNYYVALARFRSAVKKSSFATPPVIPYFIPFVGQALEILDMTPGRFWKKLVPKIPKDLSAVSIQLATQRSHVLFDGPSIHAMFRSRNVDREDFNRQVMCYGFGIPLEDYNKVFPPPGSPNEGKKIAYNHDATMSEFLLSQFAVNGLTETFIKTFREALTSWIEENLKTPGAVKEVNVLQWLRSVMFRASTTAFFGSNIFELYPDIEKDYFPLDADMLIMAFKIPKIFSPRIYEVRKRMLDTMEHWIRQAEAAGAHNNTTDEWEPYLGSRFMRAREKCFISDGLSVRGRAGFALAFLFGLSANAIPSTTWMLVQTLAPSPYGTEGLLPRLLEEARTTDKSDGELDIRKLITLPLMQSFLHEVLRVYIDIVVTREVKADVSLPNGVLLNKGSLAMAPSAVCHHQNDVWQSRPRARPTSEFDPERFLREDPKTGRPIFSISAIAGSYFPFGGGAQICPGRVFTKQEMLAAFSLIILNLQFDFLGFVDAKGNKTDKFPGFAKQLSGNGVLAPAGDIRVRLQRRN